MSSGMHNYIEQRLAELAEKRELLATIQNKVQTQKSTATSKNRSIAVTVDSRGEILEIDFKSKGYRTMAPKELSALIIETVRAAREQAMAKMLADFAPVIPERMPINDMLAGKVDFEAMMRDALQFGPDEIIDEPRHNG
jgi:DNA-binding protein YbaB